MGLSSSKSQLLGDRQRISGAYRLISTSHTFVTFQLVAMNVGNNGRGACNVTPDARNDGVSAWDIATDVGNNILSV